MQQTVNNQREVLHPLFEFCKRKHYRVDLSMYNIAVMRQLRNKVRSSVIGEDVLQCARLTSLTFPGEVFMSICLSVSVTARVSQKLHVQT